MATIGTIGTTKINQNIASDGLTMCGKSRSIHPSKRWEHIMAKPVTHLSNIRRFADRTITGTLCNRMTGGEINCSTNTDEITCKFCLRILRDRAA